MQSLWMVAAAALFAVMGVCVKLAAGRYGVAEIVFYRGLVGAVGLALFVRARGLSLRTRLPWIHVRRSISGSAALLLWFYATSVLPVATAMTLNYTSPLFYAAFTIAAALGAGRPVDGRLLATLAVGFGGVALVLQPSFGSGQLLAASLGLASGVLSAVAYWHVRDLGRRGEPEWRIVFYFSLVAGLCGLALALPAGLTRHTPAGLAELAGVGVSATLAQLAMTRAYGRGPALLTANLQFSAIVFAALLGDWVFADRLPAAGILGMVIIVAAAVLATVLSMNPGYVGRQRRPFGGGGGFDAEGPPPKEPA